MQGRDCEAVRGRRERISVMGRLSEAMWFITTPKRPSNLEVERLCSHISMSKELINLRNKYQKGIDDDEEGCRVELFK